MDRELYVCRGTRMIRDGKRLIGGGIRKKK